MPHQTHNNHSIRAPHRSCIVGSKQGTCTNIMEWDIGTRLE